VVLLAEFGWVAARVAVVEAKRHHRRASDMSEARDPGASCPGHPSPNDCCVIEGSTPASQLAGPVTAGYIESMRRFKWIEWNLQKIAAHGLSAEEVEAPFDSSASTSSTGVAMAPSACSQRCHLAAGSG
jgi:hypothetical protein